MKNDTPSYLKLHTEDAEQHIVGRTGEGFEIDLLCQAFAATTGFELDYDSSDTAADAFWTMEVEGPRQSPPFTLHLSPNVDPHDLPFDGDHRDNAEQLASEIGWLIDRVHRTERALWQREGELAVAVPVTAHPETEATMVAARLEAILACGVDAVNCHAAALYMLDDATTQLKLRSQWGLTDDRFVQPPRTLRGSQADLEALTGHAVVIEDTRQLEHWNIPEEFPAAVCVPVSTSTMPLGTLWFFCGQNRDFSDKEMNVVEVIAGRVAVELEREILLRERMDRGRTDPMEEAVAWQQQLLPQVPPQSPGWDFAGCPSYRDSLCGDNYHWHMRKDGQLLLSLCTVDGEGLTTALSSAMIAGTVRALCEEGKEADTILDRANSTVWAGSNGDRRASLFCAGVSPSSGEITFSSAGEMSVFVIRPHGWQEIQVANPAIGADEDIAYSVERETLEPGDVLLVLGGRRRPGPRSTEASRPDAAAFAELLLRNNHLDCAAMTSLLRENWSSDRSVWLTPPTALVAKRIV